MRTTLRSTIAALAAGAVALTGCAPKTAKLFPELAAEKGELQSIALLADVVVIEDVIGSTEKVYLEECKSLGNVVLARFDAEMRGKGFAVVRKPLVSVGQAAKASTSYRLLSTWSQHSLDSEQFPVVSPPFYRDSTLCPAGAAAEAWADLATFAWHFERKKGRDDAQIAVPAALTDRVGATHALVVLVAGTKIPPGKQLGQRVLSGLLSFNKTSGNVSVGFSPDLTQFSGVAVKTAIVELQTGRVLWADHVYEQKSVEADLVAGMVATLVGRMP
jgi:hypothetical protein